MTVIDKIQLTLSYAAKLKVKIYEVIDFAQ